MTIAGRRLGGWWRLWIAGAGVWGFVMLAWVYSSWPTAADAMRSTEQELLRQIQARLDRGEPPESVETWARSAYAQFARPAAQAMNEEELRRAVLQRMRAGETDEQISQFIASVRRPEDVVRGRAEATAAAIDSAGDDPSSPNTAAVIRERRSDQQIELLRVAGLIWLLPTVALLAFGLTAGWVRRGFKQAG